MLQAAYRQGPGKSVPSPFDGDASVPYWYDRIGSMAKELRRAGFTAVLLPPVQMTQSGAYPTGDGYGQFGEYMLGTPESPTRFGYRENLQRCIAVLKANGIDTYADIVNHQRDGGNNGVYEYPSATGKTNGRFPKHPGCFVGDPPRVPRDNVAGGASTDFGFGDELAPINATPKDYVLDGLIDAGNWLVRTLGIEGCRVDDVKGLAVEFMQKWANSEALAPLYMFVEYYDGSPEALDYYAWASGMNGRVSVEDFTMHFACVGFCNNASNWNMEQLQHRGGYFQWSPGHALLFVESNDSDQESFASVVFSKTLGYAYMLTSEGYPSIFYKDWAPLSEGCYGLSPWISNLIWIHELLANGATWSRHADFQTYVYERQGAPGLLVGLNNDMYNGWKTVTVQTSFGANVHLHDYTGHAGDVWTDGNGMVTIGIPENDNGQGYVCYSRDGYQGRSFYPEQKPITQVFYGAKDLDIGPAINGTGKLGRIWSDAGMRITHILKATVPAGGALTVEVTDEAGNAVTRADAVGWYTVSVVGSGLPVKGISFEVAVTYTAPQLLKLAS